MLKKIIDLKQLIDDLKISRIEGILKTTYQGNQLSWKQLLVKDCK